jgi:hypothetical protein
MKKLRVSPGPIFRHESHVQSDETEHEAPRREASVHFPALLHGPKNISASGILFHC